MSGTGFRSGTTVRLWIFSEPTFVTEVQVASDGTFLGTAPLVALPPGEHTVQVNGVSADGLYRTANVGVVMDEPQQVLPVTGDSDRVLKFAILIASMGLVAVLLGRSRFEPVGQRGLKS